ncbi:MAG: hypothetical protein R3293_07290 [Candidatus Promineifilaceae bacterium]|nr:hypothetical protein [Candidatus Promineifilaceae bacterium]
MSTQTKGPMPQSRRLLPIAAGLFVLSLFATSIFQTYSARSAPAVDNIVLHIEDSHTWAGSKIPIGAHVVWDPMDEFYVTGQPRGYKKGETAVLRVMINGAAKGEKLKFLLCLESGGATSDAFAFTNLEPDKEVEFEDFSPATYDSAQQKTRVLAVNAKLDAVTFLGQNRGYESVSCGSDYFSWLIQLTINNASLPSYILYGGHLAGGDDDFLREQKGSPQLVSADKDATTANENFKAKIVSAWQEDRIVIFRSQEISTN